MIERALAHLAWPAVVIALVAVAAGCSGGSPPAADTTEPVTPITTTYHTRPHPDSPILGVLEPVTRDPPESELEVTVLHSPQIAASIMPSKADRAKPSRFRIARRLNVIAVYPTTVSASLKDAVRAVVVDLGCRSA